MFGLLQRHLARGGGLRDRDALLALAARLRESNAMNSDALDAATYKGFDADKTGIFALRKTDLFNLLCIPPDTRDGDIDKDVYSDALNF